MTNNETNMTPNQHPRSGDRHERQTARTTYPPLTISQQIEGLRNATGMVNPMTRDDYRRPLRTRMLHDARLHLLTLCDAPPRVHHLALIPITRWNDAQGTDIRALIRKRLSTLQSTSPPHQALPETHLHRRAKPPPPATGQ